MTQAEKQAIMAEYATHEGDTGSPEVQIAVLSKRIADLTEHLGIELLLGVVQRVNDLGLANILQAPFSSLGLNVGLVAEQDESGISLLQDDVGSFKVSFFLALRQNDSLVGFDGVFFDFVYQIHNTNCLVDL